MTAAGPQLRRSARMLEQSEGSMALKLGLLAALETAHTQGWSQRLARIAQNASALRAALREVPGLTLRSLTGAPDSCGIVPFTLDGMASAQVQQALQQQGIQVAASGMGFTPLDMQARGLDSVVRASVSWQTTPQDIAGLVAALQTLAVTAA